MVTWLLGHEGNDFPDSEVNMGPAVLRIGNEIVNGVSGRRIPYTMDNIKSISWATTILTHSYRVDVGESDCPYLVRFHRYLADYLGLRLSNVFRDRPYISSRTHRDGRFNLLFRDFSYVKGFARDLIQPKLWDLEQRIDNPIGQSMIRGLSVLDSDYPELCALQSFGSPDPARIRDLYSVRLEGELMDRFDAVYFRLMDKRVRSTHEI